LNSRIGINSWPQTDNKTQSEISSCIAGTYLIEVSTVTNSLKSMSLPSTVTDTCAAETAIYFCPKQKFFFSESWFCKIQHILIIFLSFVVINNYLTSWSWTLLEKLPVTQLLKNFPTFYGTQMFIAMFTRALHWWGVVSLTSNPQAGESSLIGCLRLLIQYIRSYPPHLETSSSIRNLRTCHAVATMDPPNMEALWSMGWKL
jgi:hypothetical protein